MLPQTKNRPSSPLGTLKHVIRPFLALKCALQSVWQIWHEPLSCWPPSLRFRDRDAAELIDWLEFSSRTIMMISSYRLAVSDVIQFIFGSSAVEIRCLSHLSLEGFGGTRLSSNLPRSRHNSSTGLLFSSRLFSSSSHLHLSPNPLASTCPTAHGQMLAQSQDESSRIQS